MSAALTHRGPDAEGFWLDEGVALGHRRLSILDLSPAGAQPMQSACGRYVIAYNGEIYNHLDLRNDLAAAGAAPDWRGHSDTETLLAGIAHWGLDETLKRAKGMFAVALWDRAEKRLSLARDRMGEKPLYWGWAGSDLVFGSELKALRKHPEFPRDTCRQALAQYLRFAYVPAPRSIHPGIYKLEPGCILTVDGTPPHVAPNAPLRPGESHGSINIRRYWSLETESEAGLNDPITDEKEAIAQTENVLGDAVDRQMISDVPLGAFLSGGVDSSAIVALMQRKSTTRVQTFTIGFDEAAYDESNHAAAVAAHLGTEHHKLQVTDVDARDIIPLLAGMYDEPFADSSQIPTHLVCKAARQQVTVALSGDGGDELFGGYNRYLHGPAMWRKLSRVPASVRRMASSGVLAMPDRGWTALEAAYNTIKPGSAGISGLGTKAQRMGAWLPKTNSFDDLYRNSVSSWLEPEALLRQPTTEPGSQIDDPMQVDLGGELASWMMVQDVRSYLPDDILCKVDRAAMAVSLETRAPFLDPDVVALSARLPLTMKIRDGQGKWALRQVLHKHVPREIIERPKAGFAVPIGQWLRGPLRDWAEELLSEKRLHEDGIFKPETVRTKWKAHLSGRRDHTTKLWAILMFQAWRSHWL